MPATALRPATLLLTVLLGLLSFALPRRWSLTPILVASVLLPDDQRIVLGGLDWTMFRLLVLCSLVRVATRGEYRRFRGAGIDYLLIAFSISNIIAAVFLYGTSAAVINRLGAGFDVLGFYFAARVAIRAPNDLRAVIYVSFVCMIPLALAMVLEWRTGRNVFYLLGGVPEFTEVREGRLRCQGAFSHPIMAGLFAASWFPFFACWSWRRLRARSVVGSTAALTAVILSASSTPLLALVAGCGGLLLWRIRARMRAVRWSVAVTLLVLHLVRDAPVWHLLARINVVGGSTGWHRYFLIDQAIAHFSQWALFGTVSTAQWGLGLIDVTNQFILTGARGGLLPMLIFVAVVSFGFRSAGRAANARSLGPELRWTAWCTGSALFVHLVSFFSVSYFGQMTYVWYMHLAIAATLGAFATAKPVRSLEAERSRPSPTIPETHAIV